MLNELRDWFIDEWEQGHYEKARKIHVVALKMLEKKKLIHR